MSSSTYRGIIRRSATFVADGRPVDTILHHDAVESALHIYDEGAQVRVNFSTRDVSRFLTMASPAATGVFYPIGQPFGPYPLRVKPDGSAFKLRVRVEGAASAANSVTFKVVVGMWGNSSAYAYDSGWAGTYMTSGSTSSTTVVEISLSSDLIYVAQAEEIVANVQELSVFDGVYGSLPGSTIWCPYEISLWGSTTNLTTLPYVTGFYAAEYTGA